MKPRRREPSERSLAGSAQEARPNDAVRGTAARLRFGMNVKGYGVGGGPRRRALGSISA
jgi:hypothetical protein